MSRKASPAYIGAFVVGAVILAVVIVTHELASIFAVGNNSVFLDPDTKTMIASGHPKTLLEESDDPKVRKFLTRGEA